MTDKFKNACLVPTLRYRDARAAIDWLCAAFGFEEYLVVPGENGAIEHAQLVLRNDLCDGLSDGMIMVSSWRDDDFGKAQKPPSDLGGVVTQSVYIIVANPDEAHEKAVAAGAEIVVEIKDEDFGGRGYTCRDCEGHLWNFGSYNPWISA